MPLKFIHWLYYFIQLRYYAILFRRKWAAANQEYQRTRPQEAFGDLPSPDVRDM